MVLPTGKLDAFIVSPVKYAPNTILAKLVGIWKKECLNIKLMYPNPIPISAVELSTTPYETGYLFDFRSAKLILPCNAFTKRHLVESALIL